MQPDNEISPVNRIIEASPRLFYRKSKLSVSVVDNLKC